MLVAACGPFVYVSDANNVCGKCHSNCSTCLEANNGSKCIEQNIINN